MKKIFYSIFAAVIVLAVGCTKEEPEQTTLEVVRSDVNFTAAGGEGDIEVSTSATSVRAVSDKSWIAISGTARGTISFTVAENTKEFSRTGTITITADGATTSVSVTQMGLIFGLDEDTLAEVTSGLEISKDGGSASIPVSFNGGSDPVVEISDTWLTSSFDAQTSSIVLAAETNVSGADRTTNVKITAGWISYEFSVSQDRVTLLETTSLNFYREGSEGYVLHTTEYANAIDWTVATDADWITATKTSSDSMTIVLETNRGTENRTATVNMLGPDGAVVESVAVTQSHSYGYEFYLGDWTLSYTDDENQPATTTVTFIEYEAGESYIMSIPDDVMDSFLLLATFDPEGFVNLKAGQYVGAMESVGYYFFWCALTSNNYYSWGTSAGMNLELRIDGDTESFVWVTDGVYGNDTVGDVTGFGVWVFSSTTPSSSSSLGYWARFRDMVGLSR